MRELPRLEGEPETRSPRNRANAKASGAGSPAGFDPAPTDPVRRMLWAAFGLSLGFWTIVTLAQMFSTRPEEVARGVSGFAWVAAVVALAGLARR